MHSLAQLEKQQVGLRLPKYLIDDIDAFTESEVSNISSEKILNLLKKNGLR